MKNQTSAPLSFNDIIFEGRNKLYGAYLLRQLYNRHLILATFIAISLFMLFISIPLLARLIAPVETDPPTIIDCELPIELQQIDLPKPEEVKPEIAPPPAEQLATVRHTTPVIVSRDVNPSEEMTDADKLKDRVISTTTSEGATPTTQNPPITIAPPSTGSGTSEIKEKVFEYVEEMPMFGTGEKDLIAYLSDNFDMPQKAIKANVNGVMYLSFTVTKTGDIADIKVLKGLGYGLDEAAVALIGAMPKWKPGRQNGREVAVTYTLPFRIKVK